MNRSYTTLNLLEYNGEWKDEEGENIQYINFQIREGGFYKKITWAEAIAKVSVPKPMPISIAIIINPTKFYYKHVKKAQEEEREREREREREEREERTIENTTEIHVSGMTILFAIFVICYVF